MYNYILNRTVCIYDVIYIYIIHSHTHTYVCICIYIWAVCVYMYIENHGTLQPEVLSARCPQCFNVSGFMFVQHLWPKMGFTPGHFITEHDDKRWDFDGFWGCPIFRHTHVCFRFKVTSLWWSSLICSNECTWMWYGCFTPWIGGFHDKPTISFFSMLFVSSTILDIGPQYSLMMFNGRRWYNDVVMIWLGLKQAVHHLYTHIYTHTRIYIYMHTCLSAHTHIYIHTHIRIYIHIYVCIPAESNPWMPEVKRNVVLWRATVSAWVGAPTRRAAPGSSRRRRELGWPCLDTFWLFNDRDYIIGFMLF